MLSLEKPPKVTVILPSVVTKALLTKPTSTYYVPCAQDPAKPFFSLKDVYVCGGVTAFTWW